MHPSKHTHSRRIRTLAIAAVMLAMGGAVIGSCVFDTRTNFCEQFGIRCKEGEECATNQPVCISVGGCGNHRMDPGEACDDGNLMDGDGCSADCLSDETCGNGIPDKHANPPEECDHGKLNGTPDDTCDSTCHIRSLICGNGIVDQDQGEQCDPGAMDSADCNSSKAGMMLGCKFPRCGDGYTNTVAKEMCDTGPDRLDTPDCNGMLCTSPTCGDNYINTVAGEDCESGGKDTQSCNGKPGGPASCRAARCGDGYINPNFVPGGQATPETCDNPGGIDTTACNGNNGGKDGSGACQPASCGDHYINTARKEECDNGGPDSPGCNGNNAGSVSCKNTKCGDNYLNKAAGETCDSTGGVDSPSCNGAGGGSAACHAPVCGDHYANTQANEECDNGTDDTKECNGTSAPKALRCKAAKCGDTYLNEAAEDCDDNDGKDSRTCNGSQAGDVACKFARCGDGYLNTQTTEKCDKGDADTKNCNGSTAGSASCQPAQCGDHHVNQAAGEECESDPDCQDPMKPKCTACKCG